MQRAHPRRRALYLSVCSVCARHVHAGGAYPRNLSRRGGTLSVRRGSFGVQGHGRFWTEVFHMFDPSNVLNSITIASN
eukprot:11171702-Lingulodinium_polyedra.AAC.1